jgi:hypothetical protein
MDKDLGSEALVEAVWTHLSALLPPQVRAARNGAALASTACGELSAWMSTTAAPRIRRSVKLGWRKAYGGGGQVVLHPCYTPLHSPWLLL